jgi:hypothetical protein
MYDGWNYKKTGEHQLNFYLRISEMPSFVFLCRSASPLLPSPLPSPTSLRLICSLLFFVYWCLHPQVEGVQLTLIFMSGGERKQLAYSEIGLMNISYVVLVTNNINGLYF